MNNEILGGDYNQGDREFEHLDAKDQLNAEYGNELNSIDTELAAKKAEDQAQRVGSQTLNATEPQVTKIPAENPDMIRAAAAIDEASGTPLPEAQLQDKLNNVDEALTNPNAQRTTNEQLEKEYNEIEGIPTNSPTPSEITGSGESTGAQAA